MQGAASEFCILENDDDDDNSPTVTTTIKVLTAYNNTLNDLKLRS
jgi:hypothetical protein